MACAPPATQALFPLDEELGLVPGSLTPHLQACLTRLGSWLPFEKAAGMLDALLRVEVSEPSARRHTETWGAAQAAVQAEEVAHLERDLPPAPPGPEKQLLSVDGAMVSLVGGEWAEVKTLVLGVIGAPVQEEGEWVVHTQDLSYFSRLTDAQTFGHLALVETHRRGVETAAEVIAVTDGAEWEQGFIDYHRTDAVRILDFAHAAERVAEIGAAVWGAQTPTTQTWLKEQLKQLKNEGPGEVLAALRALTQAHPLLPELAEHLTYLEKREGHMQYPDYRAAGWPIGSGAVESGNKVVVETRLKGAGMHWAREHVNPMLALRNAVCNDRWDEAWEEMLGYQRQQQEQLKRTRRERHLAARPVRGADERTAPPDVPTSVVAVSASAVVESVEVAPAPPPEHPHPRWRPAPDHPWRRSPIGKARYQPSSPSPSAKK